jgi:hypothetical protein
MIVRQKELETDKLKVRHNYTGTEKRDRYDDREKRKK